MSAPVDEYYEKYKWNERLRPLADAYTKLYPPHRHGVPYQLNGEAIYYNKVLFEAKDVNGHPNLWVTDGTSAGTSELAIAGADPSGLFPNGSRVLTVFTDEKGVATSRSVRFNNMVGIMPVRVVASLFSQTSSITVNQTNVASAASVRSSYVPAAGGSQMATRGHSHKTLFIVLGVLAAGGAAGDLARNGSGSKPARNPVMTFPGRARPGRLPREGDQAS